MHEPWKASAPEVYLLRTTDGSVPRGLDPNSENSWKLAGMFSHNSENLCQSPKEAKWNAA